MINTIAQEIENKTGLTWRMIALRIAFGLVFMSWLGFLPMYLILHYMVKLKFFSYDLFNDGLFGVNAFVFVAGFMLLILSFTLWGFVPFALASYLAKQRQVDNPYRGYFWLFFAIASLFHGVMMVVTSGKGQFLVYVTFSVLGLAVCAFTCLFIGQPFVKKITNWIPSCLFVVLTSMFPLIQPEANYEIVKLGLRAFRVGGMVDVEAQRTTNHTTLAKGKLILQTPQNLFIKTDEKELVIVPYSQQTIIKVRG